MEGNLQDMAVADLVQHVCQDNKTAKLIIERNGNHASVYFASGKVVHASFADEQGEEAFFQMLAWEDGKFTLENDVQSPEETIQRSWSGLLLEGARRFDESQQSAIAIDTKETPMATKKKSELLSEALKGLLETSADITGAAVVGVDGLVYSTNIPQKTLDENMVGASSAAILGLSVRSTGQLDRGEFRQTLIQGEDGNIIVTALDTNTLFVGITPKEINLGMAFAEVRGMVDQLLTIL
ncbi:MAG: DUF4388 domain-containing protein [Chloroflexi bacterium]|nr:MAG: DUF4388 domain-containing protein [Chloroflexota bacterium]MBL1194149.1 DUF4388 domain-containing protein [Chloroflexota bacterium]NOH11442.1 DUF4388 domain-containing protein [Chloroflexota bacterium]